ncbi:hypothetical protein GE09DRAFT_1283919 [Coniochaeta sp. 2T2.1]|nr:hypothetical protein GE09DRAFT_1283919 [Coniochaeta sp. 2T2.1]
MSTPSGSKDKGKAREVAADAIRDNAKRQVRFDLEDLYAATSPSIRRRIPRLSVFTSIINCYGYRLRIRGEFSDFDNAVGEEVGGFLFGLA